jgi:hypothetical protein
MDELRALYPEAWPSGVFSVAWAWSSDVKDQDNPATDWDDSTAWYFSITGGLELWDSRAYYGNCHYSTLVVRSRR